MNYTDRDKLLTMFENGCEQVAQGLTPKYVINRNNLCITITKDFDKQSPLINKKEK